MKMKNMMKVLLLALAPFAAFATDYWQNTRTEETYATLNSAVDNASEGDTIKLLADLSVNAWSGNTYTYPAADDITVDLDGHTLSY